MTKNKESTRYFSSNQEAQVAKIVNGTVTANSGAGKFQKGDIVNKNASLLCECKTVTSAKESISVKKDWLIKNKEESFATRLSNNVLAFNFEPDGENYFIISTKLMKFLVEKLEEYNED